MTGEKRMLQQQPESGGGLRGILRGRGVMIGWERTEEGKKERGTERIEAGREK